MRLRLHQEAAPFKPGEDVGDRLALAALAGGLGSACRHRILLDWVLSLNKD
jgi:hypothetical protein